MTPFGKRVRELRAERSIALKKMAGDLEISAAYLSALEHGYRGLPSEALVIQICEYFGLIWDDFEAMQRLVEISHPKVPVESGGLSPAHTELANELARRIADMNEGQAQDLLTRLRKI